VRIVDRASVANILNIVIHKFINPPPCSFSRLCCSSFHAFAGCTRDSDYAMLSPTIAERKNIDALPTVCHLQVQKPKSIDDRRNSFATFNVNDPSLVEADLNMYVKRLQRHSGPIMAAVKIGRSRELSRATSQTTLLTCTVTTVANESEVPSMSEIRRSVLETLPPENLT